MSKFLYLHGFGESSLLAGMSTAGIKKCLSDNSIALDAEMNGYVHLKSDKEFDPIVDPEYKAMCKSGDLDAYGWYMLAKGSEGGHRKPPAEDFGYRADKKSMQEVSRPCRYQLPLEAPPVYSQPPLAQPSLLI